MKDTIASLQANVNTSDAEVKMLLRELDEERQLNEMLTQDIEDLEMQKVGYDRVIHAIYILTGGE